MRDTFGDRIKGYENLAQKRFMPFLPIVVRLDGKNFSKFTHGFMKPYDKHLHDAMVSTTAKLVEISNAVIGYTQSDEITLILNSDNPKSQVYFDGKISKIISVLSSICTYYFNKYIDIDTYIGVDKSAFFDCRAFQVPNKTEAVNALLWREQDATKNSISMLVRYHYSHREVNGKNRAEQLDMIMAKGMNWNYREDWAKRGTYVKKFVTEEKWTVEEIDKLPEKHEARINPNLIKIRSFYDRVNLPPLGKISNREGVIFKGEDPLLIE